MITARNSDVLQGHREEIGVWGTTGLILMLEELGVPLSLLGQLDQSLGFADIVTIFQLDYYSITFSHS